MTDAFAPYLVPREKVLWSGQPRQGLALRAIDAFLIPFSLLWTGGVLFATFTMWQSPQPMSIAVGCFLIAIGVYLVVGRHLADAYMRSRLSYALTDQRALILGGMFRQNLTEIDLRTISEIRYDPAGGSRGTISFGPNLGFFRQGNPWQSQAGARSVFFQISDAQAVYRLIRSARSGKS